MLSVKPWRIEAVLLFIAAQILGLLIGGTAISLLQKIGVSSFKSDEACGTILVGTLCLQGITWVLMPFFFRYHHVDWREALGFRNKNWFLALALALALVIIILLVAQPLQSLSIALMSKVGWKPQKEAAVALISNASSPAMQIYLGVFAVILAPVAEEFFFRGMLFPFLKQLSFPKIAWIGVNLLFALIHADAAIFIPLFVLSLGLTWLYEKTDNLIAPIFAHALFNATNLVILKYYPQ
jgi:membrane protease YdiL (CAAX protease family)